MWGVGLRLAAGGVEYFEVGPVFAIGVEYEVDEGVHGCGATVPVGVFGFDWFCPVQHGLGEGFCMERADGSGEVEVAVEVVLEEQVLLGLGSDELIQVFIG